MIGVDACNPALAWDVHHRLVQVASPAGSREPLPSSSTEHCPERGASNIYFSVIESALDIPPWSDELQKRSACDGRCLSKLPIRTRAESSFRRCGLLNLLGSPRTSL